MRDGRGGDIEQIFERGREKRRETRKISSREVVEVTTTRERLHNGSGACENGGMADGGRRRKLRKRE